MPGDTYTGNVQKPFIRNKVHTNRVASRRLTVDSELINTQRTDVRPEQGGCHILLITENQGINKSVAIYDRGLRVGVKVDSF
jgi:hypothetical protein